MERFHRFCSAESGGRNVFGFDCEATFTYDKQEVDNGVVGEGSLISQQAVIGTKEVRNFKLVPLKVRERVSKCVSAKGSECLLSITELVSVT